MCIVFLLSSFLLSSYNNELPQNIRVVNYEELKEIIGKKDDVLYVVNFWATWCKPCIEELPDFIKINTKFWNNSKFKMILVSLDKSNAIHTTVKEFLIKKKVPMDCYLLSDNKRMNYWISDIDSTWSGAIPATLFIKNKLKLHFHEGQTNEIELDNIINKLLKE